MGFDMRWVAVFLLLLLVGCGSPNPPNPPDPPDPPETQISRLDITPGGLLLTATEPSQTLEVQAFDQNGQAVEATVSWSSSDPSVVSVSADGLVTAQRDLGSARITAQGEGIQASILAVIAQPVAGAVLVTDEQIVGEAQPVDTTAQFGVGFQYRVTLQGVAAPSVGAILLASGEKPVAGKVVAVNGNTVTLEMVPIDEVFAKLDINESFDLSEAPFTTPDTIAQNFETTHLPDGRVQLRLKEGRTLSSPDGLQPQAEFGAGPFTCKTELSAVQIDLLKAELVFTTDLNFNIVWNDLQQKLVVKGQPKVSLQVTPVVAASINGKVTCKFTFGEIQIPVPGPLGLFLGAVIPIGAGFEIEGKLPVSRVGVEVKAEAGASFEMGFDCNPDCEPVQSLTKIASGNAAPVLPQAFQGLKVEASFYAFLFATLEVGVRFEETLRIEAIEATAGLKLEGKLASEDTQAADATYSSEYKLLFEAAIGAGSGFERFLDLIRVTVAKLELKFTEDIANSPTATVSADTTAFQVGDDVTFKVTLDAAKLDFPLIGYNIESVRIYQKTGNSLLLANELTASTGQSTFEIPWVATVDGEVQNNFVAFVKTKLLPGLRLELGDATIPAASITISPTSVTMAPLETQQFTATVTGFTDTSVAWTSTGGAVTNTGSFTAPSAPGSYQVTATSVADPNLKANATVTVSSGATLTFTETNEFHFEDSGPDFEITKDYSGRTQASYQLRRVSDTGSLMKFEIIGGSINATYEEDEHEVNRNVDASSSNGRCVFNETIDFDVSYSGSATPQGTVSVSFGSDNTYAIDLSRQEVPISGPYTFTHRYEILEGEDCRTDETDSGQDTDEALVELVEEDGTVDPSNPKVLSGSRTETDNEGGVTTLTWTLVMD